MATANQDGRSGNSEWILGSDYRKMEGVKSGAMDGIQNTEALNAKKVSLNSILKTVGSHRWILSRRVTQRVWVLENKHLTLCTSLPDCYLCRNSRQGRKTVMSVFLCRAAGVEGVAMEMRGRLLFTIWAPGDGSKKFTFPKASDSLIRRFCLASHSPEPSHSPPTTLITTSL